jgi:hypothetical protein
MSKELDLPMPKKELPFESKIEKYQSGLQQKSALDSVLAQINK